MSWYYPDFLGPAKLKPFQYKKVIPNNTVSNVNVATKIVRIITNHCLSNYADQLMDENHLYSK